MGTRRRNPVEGFGNNKCDVKYIVDDQLTVSRTMTQNQLAELLKSENVFLVSVNAPKATYYRKTPYKKKKS